MDTKQQLWSALTSSFPEVLRLAFTDAKGDRDVSVRILQGLGKASPYLTPAKIRDLWVEYSKHDVLFSDHTMGKVEPFLMALFNPRTVWFELFDLNSATPIGIASLGDILPGFDAKGHFAFWDRLGAGREPLVWALMEVCFDAFDLHRMSAEAPAYQRGVLRTIKRLGFRKEGIKTEGVIFRGNWVNMILFGITREEFRRITNERRSIRRGEVRDSEGDSEGNEGDRGDAGELPEHGGGSDQSDAAGLLHEHPRVRPLFDRIRAGDQKLPDGPS